MKVIPTIASWVRGLFASGTTTPGAESEEKTTSSAQDAFAKPVDHLRSTAKWTVLAFAAVGAILVAGSQLSGIGRFQPDDWRLYVAVGSIIVALATVGLAISFIISVETSGEVMLQDLVDQEAKLGSPEQIFLQRNRALLAGYSSARDLKATYLHTIKLQFQAIQSGDQDQVDSVNQWVVYLSQVIDQLLSTARYNRVQRTFRTWIWRVMTASVLAGLAVGVFAWAANPPARTELDDFRTPARVNLVPIGDEETRITRIIGADCLATPIAAIVLRARNGTAEVVTDPPDDLASQCPVLRLTIDQRYIQPAQLVVQAQ